MCCHGCYTLSIYEECTVKGSASLRLTSTPSPASVWIVAVLVVVGWGLNFVFAKEALNQVDVGAFNFMRFGGMTVIGWIVIIRSGNRKPIAEEHRRPLALVAVVGFCGYVFGFSWGLSLTSAFSASLLLAMVPLFVVILTSVIERQLPGAMVLLGLTIAIGGSVIFAVSRTSVEVGWGDLLIVLVAACYAGYLMLNRKLVDHYSPFVLTTYATTLASIPILLLTLPTLFHQEWSAISGIGWAAMMWVTVVPVFVSWSLWNWVLRHLLLQQVAPLLFIVPVVSGIAAWLVLDESIVFGQIAGAAIILLGLTVNGHATSRPRV